MNDPAATIERFYAAFSARDPGTMAACYAPAARFADPVFRALRGAEIGLMWRMLCERATDLAISHGPVRAVGQRWEVDWEARYTYSATRRPVHNRIRASMYFERGVILDHEDRFDLYGWARQALGLQGFLLGWSPPMQRAIQARARQALEAYGQRQAPGGSPDSGTDRGR